ncbi:MAG: asparagine synthase (glutamine-hydrolyzing) [Verrucomicrobia bacterium]|nr:asparagine synthase (glutamine-hydrolyzing) [Cytophagales bacterium]
MCGVTGILAYNLIGQISQINVQQSMNTLEKRGPDDFDSFYEGFCGLGFRRLSILDTSRAGRQPMTDASGRYVMVFNGEIFNFQELRNELAEKITFKSNSDTEVLVNLFALEGENCLQKLNGFFAFTVYDREDESLFLARDRFGVKPLLWHADQDRFVFASEMKALLAYGIEKQIDETSLQQYFQLNYIPAPHTIFKNVQKLLPGHWLKAKKRHTEIKKWYTATDDLLKESSQKTFSYEQAQSMLAEKLEAAVKRRLVADVPLGAFLSGGIDSSVIVGLAAKHTSQLNTFSIGYRDEPFFDETNYANLVAKHFKTNHTVFSLSNQDLYDNLFEMLDYIDEPFADSSALAVYILSKKVRKQVTVALSGDGADELFAGYNKHRAEFRVSNQALKEQLALQLDFLWKILPKSRNSGFTNTVRQLQKFTEIATLKFPDRYWRLATYASEQETKNLLKKHPVEEEVIFRKTQLLQFLKESDFNSFLKTDVDLVLANDMLVKVDLMSMANSLEVRNPFLDVEVVELAFAMPAEYKIDKTMKKKVLQDTFREMLPKDLYNRPKHGFEVPLLKWFNNELKNLITNDLLKDSFVEEQGIFNLQAVQRLKQQVFSGNPADSVATVWALLVFQYWWKKWM